MFTQTGTEFPLVAGVYGNRRLALMAFEATEQTIHEGPEGHQQPDRTRGFQGHAALPGSRC